MINRVHLVMWLCLYLDNNTASASKAVGLGWDELGERRGVSSVKRLHGYIINAARQPQLTII